MTTSDTVTKRAASGYLTANVLGVRMFVFTCAACAIPMAIAEFYDDQRRDDGKSFYCPNGHTMSYHDTIENQLRRQLKAAQQAADRADAEAQAERTRVRAARAELGRARRRAAHGVCPVPACSRAPFDNLARHMAAKHPGYITDADAAVGVQVLVDGPYGTMRKISHQPGAARYRCRCGWEGNTARGLAAKHARTCPKACEPWPATI
jgi:hypothetical protein